MHHREWGRASNTGTVLRDAVEGCEIFVKGHAEDDAALGRVLAAPTTAVLFPSPDASPLSSVDDLDALVVVDATWRNARRMVSSLPGHIRRVRLDDDAAQGQGNLLAPLRKAPEDDARVCTAQAAVAALRTVGLPPVECDRVLDAVTLKVEMVKALRGKGLHGRRDQGCGDG